MKKKLRRFLRRLKRNPKLRIIVIASICLVAVLTAIIVCPMKGSRERGQEAALEQQLVENQATEQDGNNAGTQQGTQLHTENSTEAAQQSNSSTVDDTKTAKQTVEQAAANKSSQAGSEVIGTSSKGYTIEQKDGITYVDGVLIVNKTYSLPSTYAPGDMTDEVKQAFNVMQKAAAAQGLNIYISSGYRSYSRQDTIYNNYVKKDGAAMADTYSARPGNSEHQSGLCFDLNTIDDSFALTPESDWIKQHAQKYGFIIRYPDGKQQITGYQYESWHLRYLGVELATDVYNSGLCLEEYYGITSAY